MERVLVLESPYSDEPVEQESLPHLRVDRVRLADLPPCADDVVGIIVDMLPVDRELMERLPALRAISVSSVGLDAIDLDEAARRRIRVANVAAGATEEVATHAVALLLALARRLRPYHEHVAAGGFDFAAVGPINRLSDRAIGVVGLGRIGRSVVERLRPFGAELLGWSRSAVDLAGVEQVALDDLCARADAITIHLPLAPETLDLFDARRLESLRPGCLLVNTGRGKIVDTSAAIRLARAGRLGGVALDVFREEPPGPDELALGNAAANVILTPHAAFWSVEAERAVRVQAARNLDEALRA